MFADDTKIFTTVNNLEDLTKLQADIQKLQEWSEKWLLRFNADKCKTMHKGINNPMGEYTMNSTTLQDISQEKDLGVYITDNNKPSIQCTKAAQKAMNSHRVIKRTFKYINRESFAILYTTYIRPHLEFCIQAWCPTMKKDILTLEKVQRRATKLVPELRHLAYSDRLMSLNLYSLEQRRERGDLIETFKILKGFEKTDASFFFTRATSGTRGLQAKTTQKSLKCRTDFFSQRVINALNGLPKYVVGARTRNSFKNELDRHWRDMGYLKA